MIASWISRVRFDVMTTIGGVGRADRAELGNRHLVVGQHFEQIRLERLVGAVELVDQQHRRDAVVGRRAPRSSGRFSRKRVREDVVRELVALDAARGFGEADLDHLPRIVPLVDRRRGVEAFVALQPHELARRARRRAPWRSRSCRRPPRLRGTAGAAASARGRPRSRGGGRRRSPARVEQRERRIDGRRDGNWVGHDKTRATEVRRPKHSKPARVSRQPRPRARHHRDQMRAILGRAVQVVVESARVHLAPPSRRRR